MVPAVGDKHLCVPLGVFRRVGGERHPFAYLLIITRRLLEVPHQRPQTRACQTHTNQVVRNQCCIRLGRQHDVDATHIHRHTGDRNRYVPVSDRDRCPWTGQTSIQQQASAACLCHTRLCLQTPQTVLASLCTTSPVHTDKR